MFKLFNFDAIIDKLQIVGQFNKRSKMALSLLQTLPLLVFFALVFCNCSGKEESVLLSESVISNNKVDGPPFVDLLLRRKRGRSTFSSVRFKTSIRKLEICA